jgi:hypothetical protein
MFRRHVPALRVHGAHGFHWQIHVEDVFRPTSLAALCDGAGRCRIGHRHAKIERLSAFLGPLCCRLPLLVAPKGQEKGNVSGSSPRRRRSSIGEGHRPNQRSPPRSGDSWQRAQRTQCAVCSCISLIPEASRCLRYADGIQQEWPDISGQDTIFRRFTQGTAGAPQVLSFSDPEARDDTRFSIDGSTD